MTTRAVNLESRPVGHGHRTYIIAEAGVNHDGSPALAMRLIEAARLAGADAVKFQFFSADKLVSPGAAACDYQLERAKAPDQHAMLKALELPPETFVALYRRARETEIDFLVTPFGRTELDYLVQEVGVRMLKIASPDVINLPLLDAAAAAGLPLIVSTGAADAAEVEQAHGRLARAGAADRLVFMHCVSAYPTHSNSVRLGRVRSLADRFQVPVGFSDHTAEDNTSYAAVLAGACVLEKHFTLNRDAAGPDHFFSLEPAAFRRYVDAARRAETLLGENALHTTGEEEQVRALSRGRIVAARPIRAGERFTPENLTVQRPGHGLSPLHWDEVIGRQSQEDLPAGVPLSADMLRPAPASRSQGKQPAQSEQPGGSRLSR